MTRRVTGICCCSKCGTVGCHNRQPKGVCFVFFDEQVKNAIGHIRLSATTIDCLQKEQPQ